jgi:hypothetical protein
VRGEELQKALPEDGNSRCGVFGVALNAPKPNKNPSGMQGKRDEAMTIRQYKHI